MIKVSSDFSYKEVHLGIKEKSNCHCQQYGHVLVAPPVGHVKGRLT